MSSFFYLQTHYFPLFLAQLQVVPGGGGGGGGGCEDVLLKQAKARGQAANSPNQTTHVLSLLFRADVNGLAG